MASINGLQFLTWIMTALISVVLMSFSCESEISLFFLGGGCYAV